MDVAFGRRNQARLQFVALFFNRGRLVSELRADQLDQGLAD